MAKEMRKVRIGSVVRTGMDQTAVVEIVWRQRNRLYLKQVKRITRFFVHDPQNRCQLGDKVRIQETRPISKTKHWRLLEILQQRIVAEINPSEVEFELKEAATTSSEQPIVVEPEIVAATTPSAKVTRKKSVVKPEIVATTTPSTDQDAEK